MSWKSETRRRVENLLDAYHDETIGAANLAGELYEVGGLYVMPDRLADYIEELGTVAAELNGGPPGFMLDAVKSARSDFLGTPPALRADANLEMSEIARIIAAREIERGLLG